MQIRYTYTALVLLAAAITAVGVFELTNTKVTPPSTADVPTKRVAGATIVDPVQPEPKLLMPISVGLSRVTKKPFGLKVTPETSPVENDIFTGFHTGLDFETTPAEQNSDVDIFASCEGQVIFKEWAKGYGGVLVQSCKIDGADYTVLYGHLKVESIPVKVGDTLLAGQHLGKLGQGYTQETDGRRKHLHFDIHRGTELNVHGYVATPEELTSWIDPREYLE